MAKYKSMDAHIWASILGIKPMKTTLHCCTYDHSFNMRKPKEKPMRVKSSMDFGLVAQIVQALAVLTTQEENEVDLQDRADCLDTFIIEARQALGIK